MGRKKECLADQPPCPTLSNCPVSSCLSSPMNRKKASTHTHTSTVRHWSTYIYVLAMKSTVKSAIIHTYIIIYIYSRHVIYCKICCMYVHTVCNTYSMYVHTYLTLLRTSLCRVWHHLWLLPVLCQQKGKYCNVHVGRCRESQQCVLTTIHKGIYNWNIHTYLFISLSLRVHMCTSLLLRCGVHMIVLPPLC